MPIYTEQIQRIKDKISLAKQADKELKVFGANSHQYELHQPASMADVIAFENAFAIQLPECYRAFVTLVGNGGIAYADSAAGPAYGIYPLGKRTDELIENPEKYLKQGCIIYPKMTDEFWHSVNEVIDADEHIADEDYERELGNLYGGILPIGSQGCTYLHGLVLNGLYRGRVVNLDMDRQKPKFAFEANFLDWYERWLDEVITGELIRDDATWFGYHKGGTEEELLSTYLSATNDDEKEDCISGLLGKKKISNQSLLEIERSMPENSTHKSRLIQLICKSDYEMAKPHLAVLAQSGLRSVMESVYWYAKDKSAEWVPVIEKNINDIDDDETFRFCTYVLREANFDYGKLILPFTKHQQENIRVTAFHTLGQLGNKEEYINTFIIGLNDAANRVIHITLQALANVKDDRLLEHYKKIAEKFPAEQDYILVNLNYRLADYGLNNKTILGKDDQIAVTQKTKRWFEFWK